MKVSGARPLRLLSKISDPISGAPREVQDTGSRGRPVSHSGSALPPTPLRAPNSVAWFPGTSTPRSVARVEWDGLPWLPGRWPQSPLQSPPSRKTGRGRTLKKLQQIPKAGPARDPGNLVLPASGSPSPQRASAGIQRTDPDWSGHGALGDPSDWHLLRRLLGDALGNAAATHTRICCSDR